MENKNAEKCLKAFCEKMNQKAALIGLKRTEFRSPCGAGESVASDIAKCVINGNKYHTLQKVWGTNIHTLQIDGKDPRELTVVSTIFEEKGFEQLSEKYKILGGKTGSFTKLGAFNLSFIAEVPESQERLVCAILYADEKNSLPNNRFKAARQALDAAMKKYINPEFDNSQEEVCAKSAFVVLLRENGEVEILFQKNPCEQLKPASMIKITTAMVALDYIKDLETPVTVTEEVIECIAPRFRGNDFKAGDVVRFIDLMYAMMLPSSNIASYVIGAFVGGKILETEV